MEEARRGGGGGGGRREWVEEPGENLKMAAAAASGIRTGIRCAFHAQKLHARHPFDTGLVPIKSMRNRGTFGAAAVPHPRIQPPSGSIYLLPTRGRDFMASCHKLTLYHHKKSQVAGVEM